MQDIMQVPEGNWDVKLFGNNEIFLSKSISSVFAFIWEGIYYMLNTEYLKSFFMLYNLTTLFRNISPIL